MPAKLSAVIITKNEAETIAECLRSLAFANEIVVADSGSTDSTMAIARKMGAHVVEHDWTGFGPFKQWATEQASYDWILSLDADETVSFQLRDSITAIMQDPDYDAYRMPRRNRFMGRWLQHGEGYPDWCVRLFDRRRAKWSDDEVHEKVIVSGRAGTLDGDLLHRSEQGINEYLKKQNHYTSLQAQRIIESGKMPGLIKMLLSPPLRFIKFYFLRRGFMDGIPGLVHIGIGCFNSFIKYAKAREDLALDDAQKESSETDNKKK